MRLAAFSAFFLTRRRQKWCWVGGLLALLATAFAQASPATDLYRAATQEIENNYYGWSAQDFHKLQLRYARVLDSRCQSERLTCSYATGREVLSQLLTEFGDEHTYVRDPVSAARYRETESVKPGPRTGMRVVRVEGGLLVASVQPGSVADRIGVRRLDLLTEVSGQAAGRRGGQDAPIGPNELAQLEREAQPFTVTLRRAGQEDLHLVLAPGLLTPSELPSVVWAGEGGQVALVDIPSFLPGNTAAEFLAQVRQLQGAGVKDLIVDLRFNSGGSLQQCVAAASIFGPTVYNANYRVGGFSYTGLNGQESRYFDTVFAPPEQKLWRGKAAVLIGPDTASCAEVFAYYAQRAGVRLVGAPTKGVANSGIALSNLPDGGMLAVTVFRGYAPDDTPLPARLLPDVTAPLDIPELGRSGSDTGLQAALHALGYAPAEAAKSPP